jgi:hypothetical protein
MRISVTRCVVSTNLAESRLKRNGYQTRPYQVSRHWAKALMQEWTAQALLEEEFRLQQTVMSSDDPLKEAESQIFFISKFAKPLLQLTEKVVPELSMYGNVCKQNLKTWTRIKAELVQERQIFANAAIKTRGSSFASSITSSPPPLSSASSTSQLSSPPPLSPRQSNYYYTAFPLTRPTFHLTPPTDHCYLSSCQGSSCQARSDNESVSLPDSPTESESATSSLFSPTDSSCSNKCPSTSSGSALSQIDRSQTPSLQNTPREAIRAASRLGSLPRIKDTKRNQGSRNSWSAATSSMTGGLAALFYSPPPSSASSVSGSGSTCPSAKTGAPAPTVLRAPPPTSAGFSVMPRPFKLQVSP